MTRIISTPDTCGGEPRIDGTRITVANVLGAMVGSRYEGVARAYPHLSIGQIDACLEYAARRVSRRVVGWRVYHTVMGERQRRYCLKPGVCDHGTDDMLCECMTDDPKKALVFDTREAAEKEAEHWCELDRSKLHIVKVTRRAGK